MNILIVSATEFEVKPLLDFLEIQHVIPGLNMSFKEMNELRVEVLISGIGMVNTAYAMGRCTNSFDDVIINAGVCGAFDKSLQLGELVYVIEDTLSEMGAEDGDAFLPYSELNLPGEYTFQSNLTNQFEQIESLKKVKGITVNTIHGNEISIEKIKQLYHPDVESMEGAAFYKGCYRFGVNFAQIRAVSNYVEKRDKSKWQMNLAIKNLNDFLINFITDLSKRNPS